MVKEALSRVPSRARAAAAAREGALLAAFVVWVASLQALFRVAAFIENPLGPRDPHASEIY